MMTPEEYKWTIEIIQHRYGIPLTFEQAEKVYEYEQEKSIDSYPLYFSNWEEHEYELDTFEKILTPEQFEEFRQRSIASLRNLEEQTTRMDDPQIQQVAYHQEIVDFLAGTYHPGFYKGTPLFYFMQAQTPDLKTKVEFLKAEYKRFLAVSLKDGIIKHYRYYRRLAPNQLDVVRLQNKMRHIIPEHNAFYHGLDEPSRAIADYVDRKMKTMLTYPPLEEDAAFLHQKHRQLYHFYQELNAKYFTTPLECSHVLYEPSPERPVESWSMELVLMDEKMYDANF